MDAVTKDMVLLYCAGKIDNPQQRRMIEEARRDNPQVRGWFEQLDLEDSIQPSEVALSYFESLAASVKKQAFQAENSSFSELIDKLAAASCQKEKAGKEIANLLRVARGRTERLYSADVPASAIQAAARTGEASTGAGDENEETPVASGPVSVSGGMVNIRLTDKQCSVDVVLLVAVTNGNGVTAVQRLVPLSTYKSRKGQYRFGQIAVDTLFASRPQNTIEFYVLPVNRKCKEAIQSESIETFKREYPELIESLDRLLTEED